MIGRRIRLCSTKYDGSPHWEYDSWVVLEKGPLLVTQDFAGQEMQAYSGSWVSRHHTRNHFWFDRWYNVMRLERPQGSELEGWYCNVATPAQFDGETLRYVDLDIDVRISANGEEKVLDQDEFLENSARMGYPPEVIANARRAVDEILTLARTAQFPFDQR